MTLKNWTLVPIVKWFWITLSISFVPGFTGDIGSRRCGPLRCSSRLACLLLLQWEVLLSPLHCRLLGLFCPLHRLFHFSDDRCAYKKDNCDPGDSRIHSSPIHLCHCGCHRVVIRVRRQNGRREKGRDKWGRGSLQMDRKCVIAELIKTKKLTSDRKGYLLTFAGIYIKIFITQLLILNRYVERFTEQDFWRAVRNWHYNFDNLITRLSCRLARYLVWVFDYERAALSPGTPTTSRKPHFLETKDVRADGQIYKVSRELYIMRMIMVSHADTIPTRLRKNDK